jgi:hypothetical protein
VVRFQVIIPCTFSLQAFMILNLRGSWL